VVLAKIAVAVEDALRRRARAGSPGCAKAHPLATGDGWTVQDVICTSGPDDRPFEERHAAFSIAIVLAGTFQYRSDGRGALMTPGSLLLGRPDQAFECAHQHAAGDRCLSFHYSPAFFERLVADAARGRNGLEWQHLRIPPLPPLTPLIARASAAMTRPDDEPWAELAVELAGETIEMIGGGVAASLPARPGAEARVTGVVRAMERSDYQSASLACLAHDAGLGPYQFLRMFERVTGVTPHQFVMRARLREAAGRLVEEPAKVLDIALDSGFGDVSNFNRAFRREFGVSPRTYRGLQSVSSRRACSADRTPR
jgi:AraC-like DNA-binding protein